MSTTLAPARAPGPAGSQLQPIKRPYKDIAFRWLLFSCLAVGVVFLAILLGYVVYRGWDRLDSRIWLEMPSKRRPASAGAQSAIMGSIWIIGFTALWCLPTGVMTAIYLEEYANPDRWYNRLIEVNIQNLAAVPSIVFGILGLGIIARGFGLGFTVLTASLVLALLVLPIVIIASREAIRAVPSSIRLGSLALGATQWQTIWKQVLPSAIPGMATGTILALSRAIGEAAPLLLLGGLTFITFNPDGLDSSFTALPIQIFNWTSQSREEFRVLAAATIVIMLVILLAMNSVAIWIRNRYTKRW